GAAITSRPFACVRVTTSPYGNADLFSRRGSPVSPGDNHSAGEFLPASSPPARIASGSRGTAPRPGDSSLVHAPLSGLPHAKRPPVNHAGCRAADAAAYCAGRHPNRDRKPECRDQARHPGPTTQRKDALQCNAARTHSDGPAVGRKSRQPWERATGQGRDEAAASRHTKRKSPTAISLGDGTGQGAVPKHRSRPDEHKARISAAFLN